MRAECADTHSSISLHIPMYQPLCTRHLGLRARQFSSAEGWSRAHNTAARSGRQQRDALLLDVCEPSAKGLEGPTMAVKQVTCMLRHQKLEWDKHRRVWRHERVFCILGSWRRRAL